MKSHSTLERRIGQAGQRWQSALGWGCRSGCNGCSQGRRRSRRCRNRTWRTGWRRRRRQSSLGAENGRLECPFPSILCLTDLYQPRVLIIKQTKKQNKTLCSQSAQKYVCMKSADSGRQMTLASLTLTCSELAWNVWTPIICWKRLRLMMTKPLSSFAAAASWLLISWRKKRSNESGCL